jgi:hypothetical protein
MTNEGERTRRSDVGEDHPVGPIEDEHRQLRGRLETLTDGADRAGILSNLQELPKKLAAHFGDEETVGGLYDDLAQRSPGVIDKLDALRAEHRSILDEFEEVSRAVQNDPAAGGSLSEATMGSVARCVGRLRQHERAESTMIADVYYEDEGGRG